MALEEAFDLLRTGITETAMRSAAAIASPGAPVNQAGEAATRQQDLNTDNGTPTNGVSPIAPGYASKATAAPAASTPPRWVLILAALGVLALVLVGGGRGR